MMTYNQRPCDKCQIIPMRLLPSRGFEAVCYILCATYGPRACNSGAHSLNITKAPTPLCNANSVCCGNDNWAYCTDLLPCNVNHTRPSPAPTILAPTPGPINPRVHWLLKYRPDNVPTLFRIMLSGQKCVFSCSSQLVDLGGSRLPGVSRQSLFSTIY